MRRRLFTAVMGLAAFLMVGVFAQAQGMGPTISLSESPEYGQYLTDGEGMTLYLFVEDAAALATPETDMERMTEGVRAEAAECTGNCLTNWPALLAEEGEPSVAADAEGQLDSELLYVADVDGRQQVVYNGWPLYYFANDTQAGDINGHGVGNRWFVVSPEGAAAGEVAGGGAGQPGETEDGGDMQDGDMQDDADGAGDAGMDDDAGMDGEADEGMGADQEMDGGEEMDGGDAGMDGDAGAGDDDAGADDSADDSAGMDDADDAAGEGDEQED